VLHQLGGAFVVEFDVRMVRLHVPHQGRAKLVVIRRGQRFPAVIALKDAHGISPRCFERRLSHPVLRDCLKVAWVERDNGVRLWWEERGQGPGVLLGHSYIQHPEVLQGLADALSAEHRLVRYDARGSGQSTRTGPYDMNTDVEDLLAVAEAAGPLAVVVANGDASNRAIHAAARRTDLIASVVSMETLPLPPGVAEETDALVGSGGVLSGLVATMRADYRSGLFAAIQRGNPDITTDQLRERVDRTVEYIPYEAGCGRLEEWIADQPGEDSRALGDRLIIAYEGAGGWFTADLHEHGREFLPEARFEQLNGGAISRPDLTADVVRRVIAGTPA
jgi:pimeloyl-ACP methyl ester carboxylesterase